MACAWCNYGYKMHLDSARLDSDSCGFVQKWAYQIIYYHLCADFNLKAAILRADKSKSNTGTWNKSEREMQF